MYATARGLFGSAKILSASEPRRHGQNLCQLVMSRHLRELSFEASSPPLFLDSTGRARIPPTSAGRDGGYQWGAIREWSATVSDLPHRAMFSRRHGLDGGRWPRLSALWGRTMSDAPLLLERAPFLLTEGLSDPALIRTYATAVGELPGGFSLQAVFSRDFSHRLAVEREFLRPDYRQTDTESRGAFVSFLQQRI